MLSLVGLSVLEVCLYALTSVTVALGQTPGNDLDHDPRGVSLEASDYVSTTERRIMIDVASAISVKDLVIRFGSFVAVDHLNLEVAPGELFGFLGPNGAGKTSTIKVLIGGLQPASGVVKVAGFRVPEQLSSAKAIFGYVPDTENHIDEFTGRENLELFAQLYGQPVSRIEEVLNRLELTEAGDTRVADYSKGMRRKLLIAREILHFPRVLYLDEPTANLDAHSTEVVRELLRELAGDGVTIFLTTHDMQEVEQICDRVAIMSRGKLIACDSPSEFIAMHAEQRVSIQFEKNGRSIHSSLNLDEPTQRAELVKLVQQQPKMRLHSEEFDFADVFLKLTGQAYS